MAFTIKIKKKEHEIKFNYKMLFKANTKLGTKGEDGKSQNDGAGVLFSKILEQEDDALVDIIQLVSECTENEALDAIEKYMSATELDEEEAYNQIFTDFKEEMLASGFFVKKVKKYIKSLEKVVTMLETKEDTESKMQAEQIKELADKMNSEISLSTAPEED